MIYHEVIETTKSFMRDVTVIEEEWLVELAYVSAYIPDEGAGADHRPHFYTFKGGGIKQH